jgi:N6-adenosine-specific RNA methylase IME4
MTVLVKYEAACLALQEAHRFDEVKDIRDKAEAMRVYAIQSKNVDLEIMAAEIRLRSERRLGELLIEAKKVGKLTRRPKTTCSDEGHVYLSDIDVDRKLSSRAQKLGSIAEQAFEAMVARKREELAKQSGRRSLDLLREGDKRERRAAREAELAEKIAAGNLALPDKQNGLILVDLPRKPRVWSEETGFGRAPDNHYATQTFRWAVDVLAPMIQKLAAPDCILFMWTTAASLIDDIEIMAEAGFCALRPRGPDGRLLRDGDGEPLAAVSPGGGTYRSHQVWDKQLRGMGRWFIDRHELVLLGVRGKIPCPAPGTQSLSIFSERRGEPSAKPEFIADEIDRLWPNLPKIELFRRGAPRPGWAAWGDGVIDEPPPEPDRSASDVQVAPVLSPSPAPQLQQRPPLDDDELSIPSFLRRGHPDCLVANRADKGINDGF